MHIYNVKLIDLQQDYLFSICIITIVPKYGIDFEVKRKNLQKY